MKTEKTVTTYHIVLVDDDPRIHDMVHETLGSADLVSRFDSFSDPVSFLEFLKQAEQAPDLVLLDVFFNNSGLSGVDILPYVRENHPYLPVVLLTGMEEDDIEQAQDYECTYYIPKPVDPLLLVRMVRFYLNTGQKSGRRAAGLSRELAQHKELVQALRTELADAEIASWQEKGAGTAAEKDPRLFHRLMDILNGLLKHCECMPSFIDDLERLFEADFPLLKKAVETLVRFDLTDFALPGLNIHKYKGVSDVYSMRLTKKARIFYFQTPGMTTRRLLRLDPEHDTRGMDKWLKANHNTYADV